MPSGWPLAPVVGATVKINRIMADPENPHDIIGTWAALALLGGAVTTSTTPQFELVAPAVLGAVFGGEKGGAFEALVPLIHRCRERNVNKLRWEVSSRGSEAVCHRTSLAGGHSS